MYSSLWRRGVAYLIDMLIFCPPYLVYYYALEEAWPWGEFIIGLVMSITWFVYYAVLHRRYGQTVGKMAMKIKVLPHDHTGKISLAQAVIRNVPWVLVDLVFYAFIVWTAFSEGGISGIPLAAERATEDWYVSFGMGLTALEALWIFFHPRRRSIHDLIAGTRVVTTSALETPEFIRDVIPEEV